MRSWRRSTTKSISWSRTRTPRVSNVARQPGTSTKSRRASAPGQRAARALRLLELGSGLGNLLVEARARGYDVTGVEYSASSVRAANERLGARRACVQGTIGDVSLRRGTFDVACWRTLSSTRAIRWPICDHVWRVLRPGGMLFIALPSLDSWSARLMRERWMEFKAEHSVLFRQPDAAVGCSSRAGFEQVRIDRAGGRRSAPDYVIQHFERFPVPVVSPRGGLRAACCRRAAPPAARHSRRQRHQRAGAARAACRRSGGRRQRLVGHHAGVQRAERPFRWSIEQLLAKTIPGVDIEIVIVESNSTDGTRDEVRKFEGRPRVQVIYEERPRGKGHARARRAGARDRRLHPDPGRRPRIRPQRLRDPARAAAHVPRRVRPRRAPRHGRPELEDAALHRSGVASAR